MADEKNVVFVPGFLGTDLASNSVRPGHKVWYNQTELTANGPDNLCLGANGTDAGGLAKLGNLILDGATSAQTYKNLILLLEADGWTVTFRPYDWRKSLRANGEALGSFLISRLQAKPYYVLGYSMGGLLARFAYPLVRAAGRATDWKRTLYVGTPQGGSWAAYLGLTNPTANTTWTTYLTLSIANALAGVSLVQALRNPTAARLRQVVASWPALYGLLPSAAPGWLGYQPEAKFIYAPYPIPTDCNKFISAAHLAEAAANWAYLDAEITNPQPAALSVQGTGYKTIASWLQPKNPCSPANYTYGEEGDEYTTTQQALLVNTSMVKVTVNHSNYFNDRQILEHLNDWLLSGSGDATIAAQPQSQPDPPRRIIPGKDIGVPFPNLVRKNDP